MAVYFKFKSARDFDSVPIDGHFISVGSLKEKIFESKHLGRGTDFDLMVSNAQTDEEYADESTLIPKNTSVLVRRVPGRPRKPIVTEPPDLDLETRSCVAYAGLKLRKRYKMLYHLAVPPEESEWDEFGNDLYSIPEMHPVQPVNLAQDAVLSNKADEESKIKALIDTSALDWQRQTQDGYGSGRGFGRGMGGRMMAGRGFGRGGGGLERKTPPHGYVCHRCKVPGHFIQHCPTNGDPTFDIKRVKPPTGIPKSMLMATPDGSYALPSGAVAVLRPNEAAFEKEIEGLPTTRPITDLPPELRCPLCKQAMKDAVLTSKCCCKSFCDKCIRDHILSKLMCICGATNILADDLLPNKTLRDTINRMLESTSSAENGGSLLQVQDMESALPRQPKAPSPTLSATTKEEQMHAPEELALNAKKNVSDDVPLQSVEKKAINSIDQSEATPDSMSAKDRTSQEGGLPPEEEDQQKLLAVEQGKKKKKKKTSNVPYAADMQWRNFQDFGAEAMPMGPNGYNPYWGGMQWGGMDPYMTYQASMPFMGYTPGPFDVPFGGALPQDPFRGPGYMYPVLPQRDLAELGMGSVNSGPVPPRMSREHFEARKMDQRRGFEAERHGDRDRSRSRERRVGSGADVSPMRSKIRLTHRTSERPPSPSRERLRERELEPSRHSPPPTRTGKRKVEQEDVAAHEAKQLDQKHKGSVFSRISFPAEGASKKKTTSSATERSSSKDRDREHHHHHHHRDSVSRSSNGHKEEHKPSKGGGGPSSGGRKGGGSGGGSAAAYENESSDDERHFKRRRPSTVEREREHERERRHR
ncbi:hypothetical protein QJS10_CPB12g00505 [Acorus calamus]|uniref:DWNN domain-containing protein n=1 Tax=Acorus calamus TaxID=4465 RepID=A0AAV9DM44_ACOCL|nr:hypothetical protein QJS10_CPB12g00505 [Acorus calamus]